MAFSGNYVCTSFKVELLKGVHDFRASAGDTFKLALCTSGETLDAATDSYSDLAHEVSSSGTAYTTGGETLTNIEPAVSTTTAVCDFDDASWPASTITARGGLIYNSTPSGATPLVTPNAAVVVLDFGSDKASAAGEFTVMFPAPDASNAIIRIA